MKLQLGLLTATAVAITVAVWVSRAARNVAPPPDAVSVAKPAIPPSVAISAPTPTATAAGPAPRASASAAAITGEAAFMRDLRALAEMDAELTIERAREGAARFGASADAPERRSILIHALARMGLASEARGEAESMVNECPDSSWVREVERFTGAHRHRNIRLAANGQLEYR